MLRISKIQTFESNSQHCLICLRLCLVAQNIKDTNFWKQFTTVQQLNVSCLLLLRISKIQTFESNSQLSGTYLYDQRSCSEYQRYKLLKAIHNVFTKPITEPNVAQNIKDTNFWKQFTTWIFKSEWRCVLLRISKIQTFESNSQHMNVGFFTRCVAQNIKDTNFWKQFTTYAFMENHGMELLRISKIQTFESNSQQC